MWLWTSLLLIIFLVASAIYWYFATDYEEDETDDYNEQIRINDQS